MYVHDLRHTHTHCTNASSCQAQTLPCAARACLGSGWPLESLPSLCSYSAAVVALAWRPGWCGLCAIWVRASGDPPRHQERARTRACTLECAALGGAAPAWPGAARPCPSRRRCYYGDHQSAQWCSPTSCKRPLVKRKRVSPWRAREPGGPVCTGAAGEGGGVRIVRWEKIAGSGARTSEKHRCRDRRPGRHQLRRHLDDDVDDVAFGLCVTVKSDMGMCFYFFILYVCGAVYSRSRTICREHTLESSVWTKWALGARRPVALVSR
jgi:hypothetical protein